ncbi:hypothetical protein OESDEN_09488 [Oesophagostomum dentatum]|uniref:Uncharacterized protein n=1 Tax=Oesophagostomum dentatum TaxID=61180 RepID=A0A0B1T0D2_OESDE|nr:hypothetical protein OESDEN_09488 [Oesophagostomum dentatum]
MLCCGPKTLQAFFFQRRTFAKGEVVKETVEWLEWCPRPYSDEVIIAAVQRNCPELEEEQVIRTASDVKLELILRHGNGVIARNDATSGFAYSAFDAGPQQYYL